MPITLKKDVWKVKDPSSGQYRGAAILSTTLPQDAAQIISESNATIQNIKDTAIEAVDTALNDESTGLIPKAEADRDAIDDSLNNASNGIIPTAQSDRDDIDDSLNNINDGIIPEAQSNLATIAAAVQSQIGQGTDKTLSVAKGFADAKAAGMLVKVSNYQPGSQLDDPATSSDASQNTGYPVYKDSNRVWVKETYAELEVPTMDDHNDLKRTILLTYGDTFTDSKDTSGGKLSRFPFIAGHTYLVKNTSSVAIALWTRIENGINLETITSGMDAGSEKLFTPTLDASYVYAYGNNAYSYSIMDTSSPGNAIKNDVFKNRQLLTSSDDLNSIIKNGSYYFTSSSIPSHSPISSGGELLVFKSDSQNAYITQLYTNVTSIYYRYKATAGWTEWNEFATAGYVNNNAFMIRTNLTSSNDLNAITLPGTYKFNSASLPNHVPINKGGTLNVYKTVNEDFVVQTYINTDSIYIRMKTSNGWNEWVFCVNTEYLNENGFTTKTILTSSNDLNSILSPGTYKYNSSSVPENAPVGTGGTLNVFRATNGEFIVQMYIGINAVYYRMKTSSNWGNWQRLIESSNENIIVNGDVSKIPEHFEKIAVSGYYEHSFSYAGYEYKSDSTKTLMSNFTDILDCPKYLAFVIPENFRLEIYIGDIVDNEFVIDDNYIIKTDSNNVINLLGPNDSCAIRTDGTKKYYYRFYSPYGSTGDLFMLGCNNWKESEIDPNYYYWKSRTDDSGQATGLSDNSDNSIIIPTNCFYAVRPKTNGFIKIFKCNKSNSGPYYFSKRIALPIGFVPQDINFALVFPADINKTVYDLDTYIDTRLHFGASGAADLSVKLAKNTNKFSWTSKAALEYPGAQSDYVINKLYCGIPYSSRWVDAHFIGFEVSPETALNAANDPLSIWYDKTTGRTAVPYGKGAGYGHVCSSYASFVAGSDYPQTNKYFSFDENFEISKSQQIIPGYIYSNIFDEKGNGAGTHCVYNAEVFNNGYTLYEATLPYAHLTRHTYKNTNMTAGQIGDNSLVDYNYLNEYGWNVALKHRYGFDDDKHTFTDFDNCPIANGDVRPWRGNKCVYGPWDKTEGGCGIWATIHGATKAYMKKPDNTTVEYTVSDGTVINIAADVTQDGTYELYGNANPFVKEYFRYRAHDPVTLHVETDGTATFSSNDVDYCYVYGDTSFGKGLAYLGEKYSIGDVVANTAKYKAAKYPGINPEGCYAAMVYDEWGRYAVPCSLI